jgi:hypothetical protein
MVFSADDRSTIALFVRARHGRPAGLLLLVVKPPAGHIAEGDNVALALKRITSV